jgi:acyl-CoA synthetase (NDP forming)
VAAVEDLLVRVGRLVEDVPQIAELDLNPVRVSAAGVVALDVKVRVEGTAIAPSPLLRAL